MLILTCLISLDIFAQFFIGKNILGYSPVVINENIILNSGIIFGEELKDTNIDFNVFHNRNFFNI